MNTYKKFIDTQSQVFNKIFIIIGNHEYYHRKQTISQIKNNIQKICNLYNNVFLLDKNAYQLTPTIKLIGCTLWTDIDEYGESILNDFNYIRINKNKLINKNDYINMHDECVGFILEEINKTNEINKNLNEKEREKIIILTHHAPSLKMCGKFKGDIFNSMSATNLEFMIKEPIYCWASGHVHSNVDININNIRSVSNAVGYKNENSNYKDNVVINII